ncbi:hypothetical protein [Flavobacterium ajazii]|uniref:hypothetical protein n=1 Tax=Flavobacterium ajazii TaxID=2692318 RepID=UPI0013D5543A|nr:hypothetical protein [Flavobacterium ajazii]
MKTSNIIISSFLIFLFGGILLLYIGSKYYKSYDDPAYFLGEEKPLYPFSVVVAEPGAVFHLVNGKENKIHQLYLPGTVPNIKSFKVRNDTLFVVSEEPKKGRLKHTRNVTEIVCTHIKSVVAKENSDIRIMKFRTDTLNIITDKSKLDWRFDKAMYALIQSKESSIHLDGDLESANLKLDKTALYVNSKQAIKDVSGFLINDSFFDVAINGKIRLDVDKTSSMYFRD